MTLQLDKSEQNIRTAIPRIATRNRNKVYNVDHRNWHDKFKEETVSTQKSGKKEYYSIVMTLPARFCSLAGIEPGTLLYCTHNYDKNGKVVLTVKKLDLDK
jgi:hypothetical protein